MNPGAGSGRADGRGCVSVPNGRNWSHRALRRHHGDAKSALKAGIFGMGLMSRCYDRTITQALLAVTSVALAACSAPDLTQVSLVPKIDRNTFIPPNFNEFQMREQLRGPVGPNDLIDAAGRCPDVGPAQAPDVAANQWGEGTGQPAQPPAHPVALKMTECALVRTVGAPSNVEIGANERGDRAVRIEYKTGDRPGIYHFIDGRLVSIQRVNEPAPAPVKK